MTNHEIPFGRKITVVLAALAVSVVTAGLLGLNAAGTMLDALETHGTAISRTAWNDAVQAAESARWLMGFLLVAGLAAVVAVVVILHSSLGQLHRMAEEMLEGAGRLSELSRKLVAATHSLAQGASEQVASLEQSSSSAAEITAITRKNTENTQAVAELMNRTAGVVEGANHNLEEMVRSMKEIDNSSDKISRIIRVIDEIAFQTNILALNAAVEAARAGEAGMGFAVVAEEVRNLAQRSAQAARDTAALIEESIAKSQEGSHKLQQVAGSIGEITNSATEVKTLVDEVEAGSQEQARGIEQIAHAVAQMGEVTQDSAARAEQGAGDTDRLAEQAQSLYQTAERLKRHLGGNGNARTPQPERTGAAPHVSTHSADLKRMRESLAAGGKTVIPPRSSFPLEESEHRA